MFHLKNVKYKLKTLAGITFDKESTIFYYFWVGLHVFHQLCMYHTMQQNLYQATTTTKNKEGKEKT